jgi:hypothetical protein
MRAVPGGFTAARKREEIVDRKEFLKNICGLGVCSCALGLPAAVESLHAEDAAAIDQRLVFARYQLSKMVGFIAADTTSEAAVGILQKTGRECARISKLHANFKNDPEGYFAAARKNWGTDFSWDRKNNRITVAVAEGPCGCPLVDPKRTPALWCNCSVGYQLEAFETIFGKVIHASLKESKLKGSKRCIFEIKLT